eukprot:5236259-Alexandrium_andersonii.AAC.1
MVVDAEDTHDKCNSDASSHGARKSMAFTTAWLKEQFRGRNLSCRWADASNMLTDALAKDMGADHLRRILAK